MNESIPDELADEAIDWFVRLRADDVSQLERTQFFSWLRGDRLHQQAFVEILDLWDGLGVVGEMDFDELKPFPLVFEFKRKVEAAAY